MMKLKPVYSDIVTADARELIFALTDRLPSLYAETARRREYADLAGEGDPCQDARNEISHLIGLLKRAHADIGDLAGHQHMWGDNDYCLLCGADGRA